MKEMKVDAIKCGTVIDHIPGGKAFKIVDLLGIGQNDQVMIGTNLYSAKYGQKDVIKIENRILSEDELNSISLVGPNVTVSIIEEFHPVKKSRLEIPDVIKSILPCPNRHCITNNEDVVSHFTVETRDPLKMRCYYCERVFGSEFSKFIK